MDLAPPPALGPFDLLGPAGEGGMATVYAARHRPTGCPVAVKVVTGPHRRASTFRRWFAREVRAVARLDHPRVIRIHEHGRLPPDTARALGRVDLADAPFLVMAWHGEGTLRAGLSRTADWPTQRAWLLDLLAGLAHAHARGIVHRDLKPGNVLLDGGRAIIADFGLAFDTAPGDDTMPSGPVGTPLYMAPEQARAEWQTFGPPTDLYAVGCIAYALACGRPPFSGAGGPLAALAAHTFKAPPPLEPRRRVPMGLDAWIRRLLAKAPGDRFPFAADAAHALRALGDVPPDRPPPAGAPIEAWQTTVSLDPADAAPDTLVDPPRLDDGAPAARACPTAAPPPGEPRPLLDVGRSLVALRTPPACGRDAELATLRHHLRAAIAEGGARAVFIESAAGLGKTHLAEALAAEAHEAGVAEYLVVRHGPAPGPTHGVGPALAHRLGIAGVAPAERTLRAAEWLGAPPGDPLVGALATVIADDRGSSAGRATSPGERTVTLARALAARAARRPLVVLLDDVQWSPASLALAERLLDACDAPLLALVTVRRSPDADRAPIREAIDRVARHPRSARITLGPVDAEAVDGLCRALLSRAPALTREVAARAAGHPLFAVELLRHWIEANALEGTPAGFAPRPAHPALGVRDLADVWARRLDAALADADPRARAALEIGAALGSPRLGDEWRAACAAGGVPWPAAAIERLLDRRLIEVDGDDRWAMAHALLGETLLAAARVGGRLRACYRACARMLAARDGDPLRLARLWLAGGAWTAVVALLDPLLDDCAERYAPDEAGSLVIDRARALRALGVDRTAPAFVRGRIAWVQATRDRGRLAAAARHATRAVRHARAADEPGLLCDALYALGYSRVGQADFAIANAPLYEALAIAEAAGLTLHAARVHHLLGDRHHVRHRLDGAEEHLRAALDRLGGRAAPGLEGRTLVKLALVLALRPGGGGRAQRMLEDARDLLLETGHRQMGAAAILELGNLARRRGALDEADHLYETAAQIWDAQGYRSVTVAELSRALTAIERADFALAERRAAHARARADRMNDAFMAAAADATLLPIAAHRADWAGFDASLTRLYALGVAEWIDLDFACCAHLAAHLSAAHPARSDAAWRIAAAQYHALGLTVARADPPRWRPG